MTKAGETPFISLDADPTMSITYRLRQAFPSGKPCVRPAVKHKDSMHTRTQYDHQAAACILWTVIKSRNFKKTTVWFSELTLFSFSNLNDPIMALQVSFVGQEFTTILRI